VIINDTNTLNKIVKELVKSDIKLASDSYIDLDMDVDVYGLLMTATYEVNINFKSVPNLKELLAKYKSTQNFNDIPFDMIDKDNPISKSKKPADVLYKIVPMKDGYHFDYEIKKSDILVYLRNSKLNKI